MIGSGIILGLALLLFAPALFGHTLEDGVRVSSWYPSGSTPEGSDALLRVSDAGGSTWLFEPALVLDRLEWLVHHRVPLWDPYVGYGQPLAANMQSQPFSPFAWVAMLIPNATGYDLMLMLRIVAAGLFSFFFLRKFCDFLPALVGGLAYLLSGFLWVFLTMPELSVEAMLPAVFFTAETVIRRPTYASTIWFAVALSVLIFGGMPESTFLSVFLLSTYVVARLLGDPRVRAIRVRGAIALVCGSLLAGALTASLLLPFLEFMRRSFTVHTIAGFVVGLGADAASFGAFALYLAPLLHGPPENNIFSDFGAADGYADFLGVSQVMLAIVAIGTATIAFVRRRERLEMPVFFFAAAFIGFLLKRFGVMPIQAIGALPGFRLIDFTKYDENLISFSCAMLAAFGAQYLIGRKANKAVMWLSAIIPLALLTADAMVDENRLQTVTSHQGWFWYALVEALLALAVTGAIFYASRYDRWRPLIPRALPVLVVLDVLALFYVPVYVFESPPPSDAVSPLAIAPKYIDIVKRDNRNGERVFGEDGVLFPNWSGAAELQDVRDLDAIYDSHYLPFVKTFMTQTDGEELQNRFVGVIPQDFGSEMARRFLDLSSIGYVLSEHPIGHSSGIIGSETDAHTSQVGATFHSGFFDIGGKVEVGLFMHPPDDGYAVGIHVPANAKELRMDIGMLPPVWNTVPVCGDGVNFSVAIASRGLPTLQATRYIDPKHNAAERRWNPFNIDVRRFAGRSATLTLQTKVGPSGGSCMDWAAFGGVTFDSGEGESGPFRLMDLEEGVAVYRYDRALPRIALYENAINVADDNAALAMLTSPSWNPRTTAIVTDAQSAVVTSPAPHEALAASVDEYTPSYVSAETNAAVPALAVLNDTMYPGWHAYVDDRAVPIVSANYLFRGVDVPAGRHHIVFRYEPLSFRAGLLAGAFGIVVAAAVGIAVYRRGRSVRKFNSSEAEV